MEAKIPHRQDHSTFQLVGIVATITLKTKIKRFFFFVFCYDFLKRGQKSSVYWKGLLHIYPTWQCYFYFFHSHKLKPKLNHCMASSIAKKRSTKSQICMKYMGIVFVIKRNLDAQTGDLKIFSKYGLFSRRNLLISPIIYVSGLQHYAWLESYECQASFGAKIWGLLIQTQPLNPNGPELLESLKLPGAGGALCTY